MLIVSVPHNKMLDLNRRYWVYDTDDGVAEQVHASDILRYLHMHQADIIGITPCLYGGMLGTLEKLPDGVYPLGRQGTFTIKNGVTTGGCDFLINPYQGVCKGAVVNIRQ